MRVGSLFAGYDGLGLAVESLWPESSRAWFVEFDPAPSRILAHHWPTVPNLGDITQIDWSAWHRTNKAIPVQGGDANGSLADIDVLTGGFP